MGFDSVEERGIRLARVIELVQSTIREGGRYRCCSSVEIRCIEMYAKLKSAIIERLKQNKFK